MMFMEYDVPYRPPSELLPDPEKDLLLPLLLLVVSLLGAMFGMIEKRNWLMHWRVLSIYILLPEEWPHKWRSPTSRHYRISPLS